MNRYKNFVSFLLIVWVFLNIVGLVLELPGWREIIADPLGSKWLYLVVFGNSFLIAAALVIFCRLRYLIAWTLVLIALAIAGTGIDIPIWFVMYPEGRSVAGALFTFLAVLTFRVLEELVSRHVGWDVSDPVISGFPFPDDDEFVKLDIDVQPGASERRRRI